MIRFSLLGSGFISDFYAQGIAGYRQSHQVQVVYSRNEERARDFAGRYHVPHWTTSMEEAIHRDDVDVVVIGLPNHLHLEAVLMAAEAGKAVLCTKPLGRNGDEALKMLQAVESANVFHGYLEDLVYAPKTLKAVRSVRQGAIGRVLWSRSRETHSGPHSEWFWDKEMAGGGALIDLGCHCIEIARHYIGKDILPVEVMCWMDTQVKPIDAEDHAIGLVKYENGAMGQFEVSWSFRGGLDLRDEVMGDQGTIWINNFLRTGFEMFSASGSSGYVAEKAETDAGWLYPVGDETVELGYLNMFNDMMDTLESGKAPLENFYDGYVVNCIMDAAYKSASTRQWEKVDLPVWRGRTGAESKTFANYDDDYFFIKEEMMPNGSKRLLLKHKETGKVIEKIV